VRVLWADEGVRPYVFAYFGCGMMRKYGRGAFQPLGYFLRASSSETAPLMITSSPGFQFTGVDT
jgi:hypothetical protein